MKRNYTYIIMALLISLFIYMFYRSENTVVNELLLSIISKENFIEIKQYFQNYLPLNEFVIYSLPEGLWVFCITITSKNLLVRIRQKQWNIVYFPLFFSIGLELIQLFHFTKGRFDFWDIGISILFWVIGNYILTYKSSVQNVFNPFNSRSLICISSYWIVFLSYVWK